MATRGPLRPFLLGGLGLTLLLAGIVSFFASSSPDGLEAVAEDKGFLDQATDHVFGRGRWPTTVMWAASPWASPGSSESGSCRSSPGASPIPPVAEQRRGSDG